MTISMPDSSESAVWTGFTNANYGSAAGYPGYATTGNAWPAAIAGNPGSTLSATFNKVSGGGYFASSSLYDAGTSGTFVVGDASPLLNLSNVVFQADAGSAFAAAPLLTINGSGASVSPTYSATSTGSYFGGFGGPPAPTTNYAWQWDLSAYAGTINSYEIHWSTTPHGTIYQLNLDAGNSFVQAVPEPGSCLLGAAALGLIFIRRRRA